MIWAPSATDWWPRLSFRSVAVKPGSTNSVRKTVSHPLVGPITVDCDVLTAPDTELHVVVFTVEPGSPARHMDAVILVDPIEYQRSTGEPGKSLRTLYFGPKAKA